jgi:hypothetical protein
VHQQGDPTTDIGWSIPGQLIDPFTNPHPNASLATGPCTNDRRHLFNLTSVLASRGIGNGLMNVITRDWQVGFIFQARSGSPLTPGVTADNALTGEPQQRPLVVEGVDPYLKTPVWVSNHTQLQWIDMTAFANPAPGQRGNAGNGSLRGPRFWNADIAFSRNVTISGERRVELRVEAFNVFNRVNWANPNVTVDNANAGRITNTSGDPRIMQFAVKYGF